MAIRLASLARPAGSRYLEIGCGFGLGLDIARRSLGWDGIGIDPSPFAAAGRKVLGLPIEQRLFSIDDPLAGQFDIVHASEFLEHVPDPLGMLLTLRGALAPGGTLLLTTPAAEMIRPDTPEGLLIPLLSIGWHIVLQTESSLSMLLQKAGFSDFRVWREGAQLIALAGELPVQTEQNLSVYHSWLLAVAQAVPEASDLGLGVRARFFRELAASGKHDEAEIAWRELDHATLQRFHKGLVEFYAAPPAPSLLEFYRRPSSEVPHKPLEALASSEPLFLAGVLFARGLHLAQQGGDPKFLFYAAKQAAARLRSALRGIGSDDGDAGDVESKAEAELTLLRILEDREGAAEHLAALNGSDIRSTKVLRWRCFVELVNRARFSDASMLGDLVSEVIDEIDQLDHLRASVIFCAAAMELQIPSGRKSEAHAWLVALRLQLITCLKAGNSLPAKELYWPCVEAECLALNLLGRADKVKAVYEQTTRDVAAIPELHRE
ncbi:MAG: class I SAM-dependent methyltransferase [Roseomonas sp.]|nr:class I SAM-dependent methyltransferase [Roseomonas sp.]MCA3316997.1 class I SAM-dependent methyltransferase [Roseomonas sp.]MCA3319587.1 class I SAM-dependent methyltransferase [Roseomonas sp.]